MKGRIASRAPSRASLRALVPLWIPGLVSLLLAAVPVPAEEPETPSTPEAVAGVQPALAEAGAKTGAPTRGSSGLAWAVEGYLRQDIRWRNVSGDNDVDLYTHVAGTARHTKGFPFLVRVNARLNADVGGNQQPGDLLRDVWDSFGGDVQVRLYEAYFETSALLDDKLKIRAGRQFLDEGLYLHYDGVRADYDLGKLMEGLIGSVVGGVPVKFGETGRSDDWLAGLVLRGRLTDRLRGRLEYYHVSEFFEGINDPVVDPLHQPESHPARHLDDDYLGFTGWYRLRDNVRLYGRFSLLNGDANELHLRARWFTQDGRWAAVLEWYQLFERLRNVTNDLTPFVPMLGSYEPFYRIGGRVTFRPSEPWVIQAGLSHRELDQESDEGPFNHEYNNYYLSGTRLGLLDGRLDLTVTANGYSTNREEDIFALGGHASFRLTDAVELTGGIDYSLYKYDFFQDTEREDVWTYTVRARWKIRPKMRLEGGLTVDDDRFETYTTFVVRLTLRW